MLGNSMATPHARRHKIAVAPVKTALLLSAVVIAACEPAPHGSTTLLYAVRSDYSHILVRESRGVRSLYFVREDGYQALETAVRMETPHLLQLPYARTMFTHLLLAPRPKAVLIVGLGGGAMVHFINHYMPEVAVDAVEIDPEVVKIAERYFHVTSGGRNTIITADAFAYLAATDKRYDVIYMDAFLQPSADTDVTGVPLRLKTTQFYRGLHSRLQPGGLVAVNVNNHAGTEDDIAALRNAFAQSYIFGRQGSSNVIVLGSPDSGLRSVEELQQAALRLDRAASWGFSFVQQMQLLRPEAIAGTDKRGASSGED